MNMGKTGKLLELYVKYTMGSGSGLSKRLGLKACPCAALSLHNQLSPKQLHPE
jgi:hypothetical protein